MFAPDSPELVAFVDWELATIGDPLIDLGWVMATWADEHTPVVGDIEPWDGFPSLDEPYCTLRQAFDTQSGCGRLVWCAGLFQAGDTPGGDTCSRQCWQGAKGNGDHLHAMTISLFNRAHRLIAKN